MDTFDLSIIVPVFNEEDNIRPLHRAIVEAVEPLGLSFEIVLVDDGSRDQTFARAKQVRADDPRVRIVRFRRNYGQTPAMAAGIELARGRVLVTMDGDLQNDPADIPVLLDQIAAGHDIVVGWRRNRQDRFVSRVLPSRIANWLIARVTGVPIKDNGCSLKAYRAELMKGITLYSEMHRFIPAVASIAGARIAQVPVRHHARRFGRSKYGITRVYRVLLDLVTIRAMLGLAARPLFAFTGAALLAGGISLGLLIEVLLGSALFAEGESIVFLTLSLLLGALALFLVTLGLLAQLVYKTGGLKLVDFSRLTASLQHESPTTQMEAGP
jgi:glycosyltransferase involved in cell wall biosynthesis